MPVPRRGSPGARSGTSSRRRHRGRCRPWRSRPGRVRARAEGLRDAVAGDVPHVVVHGVAALGPHAIGTEVSTSARRSPDRAARWTERAASWCNRRGRRVLRRARSSSWSSRASRSWRLRRWSAGAWSCVVVEVVRRRRGVVVAPARPRHRDHCWADRGYDSVPSPQSTRCSRRPGGEGTGGHGRRPREHGERTADGRPGRGRMAPSADRSGLEESGVPVDDGATPSRPPRCGRRRAGTGRRGAHRPGTLDGLGLCGGHRRRPRAPANPVVISDTREAGVTVTLGRSPPRSPCGTRPTGGALLTDLVVGLRPAGHRHGRPRRREHRRHEQGSAWCRQGAPWSPCRRRRWRPSGRPHLAHAVAHARVADECWARRTLADVPAQAYVRVAETEAAALAAGPVEDPAPACATVTKAGVTAAAGRPQHRGRSGARRTGRTSSRCLGMDHSLTSELAHSRTGRDCCLIGPCFSTVTHVSSRRRERPVMDNLALHPLVSVMMLDRRTDPSQGHVDRPYSNLSKPVRPVLMTDPRRATHE